MKIFAALTLSLLCCSCSFVVVKKGDDIYVRDSTNFTGKWKVKYQGLTIEREGNQDAATATNATGNQVVRGMVVAGGGAVGL